MESRGAHVPEEARGEEEDEETEGANDIRQSLLYLDDEVRGEVEELEEVRPQEPDQNRQDALRQIEMHYALMDGWFGDASDASEDSEDSEATIPLVCARCESEAEFSWPYLGRHMCYIHAQIHQSYLDRAEAVAKAEARKTCGWGLLWNTCPSWGIRLSLLVECLT